MELDRSNTSLPCFSFLNDFAWGNGSGSGDGDGGGGSGGPYNNYNTYHQLSWKREDIYLVQYPATQALGLLLRSNPNKWWSHISPIFSDILVNPNHAAMVKCCVISTYGKIAHYMLPESSYYYPIRDLLVGLSRHNNLLVSKPAIIALCDFSLVHTVIYEDVKNMLKGKILGDTIVAATAAAGGGGDVRLSEAKPEVLKDFLRVWCKMITKDHHPMVNSRSTFIDNTPTIQLNSIQKDFTSSVSNQCDMMNEEGGKNYYGPARNKDVSGLASSAPKLLKLCTDFSSAVLESILLLFSDETLFGSSGINAEYGRQKKTEKDFNYGVWGECRRTNR
eukprot:TRINITY_DN9827_c0_g1_i1.p1 TRINITY_DN9827_c0_g1~~TRINITY_DN9827_c0_g1_i1.p1  ORF type:complete len:392 (+),score=90.83 TRINITY_DN9827_c0_g1_i1:177-1178(+)